MKRLFLGLAFALAFAAPAAAQPVTQRVAVCDPTPYANPVNCIKPNADGSINTSGGGGGGGDATAANQTAVQANPGADASKAVAVQGVTNGKAVPVSAASLPLPSGAAEDATLDTLNGKIDTLNGKIDTLNSAVAGAVPAGTNTIGATAGESATGSAVPAKAAYAGANSSGNLVGIIQADNSAPINISTATTTQLVALSSGKKIYITNYKVIAGGTGNFKFVYGTGTACGTGTADLEGANNLTAQSGSVAGSGLGPVLVVPAGNALCATTSAAVQMSGHVAYTQF